MESMTTRFVIDQDREPHLAGIQEIYVKPAQKLYEMREFGQQINNGEMKLDSYTRCLQQFMIENPTRQEFSLEQPIDYQRRNRCRGEFCNTEVESNSRSGIISFLCSVTQVEISSYRLQQSPQDQPKPYRLRQKAKVEGNITPEGNRHPRSYFYLQQRIKLRVLRQ